MSIENLNRLNQSVPRNRRIANILYYHKIFESWGRGIQMIMEECHRAGHPTPLYRQEAGGILLTLPSREPIGNTLQKPLRLERRSLEELSSRQKEIVFLLKEHSGLSPKKLQILLKTPVPERTLREELSRLKKLGFINFRGKTRNREWFVIT